MEEIRVIAIYCFIQKYDMNTEVADELLRDLYRVNAMIENGMTAEQAGSVMSVQIEKNTESLGVDQMQNYWYTYIMIFALYMVCLLYTSSITIIGTKLSTLPTPEKIPSIIRE